MPERRTAAGPLAAYVVGMRVMTREGYPGTINDIHEGPADLTTYWVALDAGMGGGQYAEAEIWPLNEQTASTVSEAVVDHTAADDYPELGSILSDRLPPHIRSTVAHLAMQRTAGFPLCAAGCMVTLSADDDLVNTGSGMAHRMCLTAAVPLLCRDCGLTYYTDNMDDPHHEDCQSVNGEILSTGALVDRDQMQAGDQFVRDLPSYKGKPTPTTYTVVGYEDYKGKPFVIVRSRVQGEGVMSLDALPEQVEVINRTGVKRGFYLPLNSPAQDQKFDNPDEQRGWQDGVADGKAGITRNVQDPTNVAYRAGYDRGWAYGVEIYRAPAGGFDLGDFQTIEQMQTVDPPTNRLGAHAGGEADLPFFEAGQLWELIKGTDPNKDPHLIPNYTYDWCRYRRQGECFYSKDLDTEASQEAGYAVWKPEDRGPCYRNAWKAQQACPIALPGSNVPGGFTDATVAWEKGGQHGGVPSNVLRQSNRLEKVRDAAQALADGLPRCTGCGQAYTEIEGEFHDHWTAKEAGQKVAAQAECPICADVMLSQVLGMSCMKCGTVIPYCSTQGLLVLSDDGLLEDMRQRFAADQSEYMRHPDGRGWIRRDGEWYLERGAPMYGGGTAWLVHKRHPADQVERTEHGTAYDAHDGQYLWSLHSDVAADNEDEGDLYKHIGDAGSLAEAKEWVRSHEGRHQSALDPSIAFMLTATWKEVQDKAKRIRSEGGVRIIATNHGSVVAYVKGDTNVYETEVVKSAGSNHISHWTCGCKWAAYSWGRSGPWKKYEGRMCSHALALQYEAQARNMFGREMTLDEKQPSWMDTTVPVRTPNSYDRNKGRYSHLHPVTEQDDEAPIQTTAKKTKSFPAKVWGKFVRLFIKDGQVQDADGTVYAAKDVLFPGYDPRAGLDYVDPEGHTGSVKTASPLDDLKTAKDLNEAADDLLASARIEERVLTPLLTSIAAKEGGRMAGLEYRFKSKDSLLRKMRAEANLYPNPGQCAMNMSDSLRYTMLLPDEAYTKTTQQVLDALKSRGFTQRVKNYWQRGDCVDMETQCLTRRGWVNGDDLTYSDEILVVDQKTGTTLWTPVEGIHVFEDREYEVWSQRGFEVAATPGHQWLVQHHRPQRPGTGSRGPKGVDRGLRLVSTGGWTKYDHVPLALPCEDVQAEAKWSDDLVELIAWVMCEGHYRRDRGSVTIAQKVHAARVEALLRRVGVSTVGRMDRIGCQQWEFGGDLARQVRVLAPEKAPTVQWLGELTQAQLELFLNVCEMADGSSLRSSGRRRRSVFFQDAGPRLDSWLTACVLAGRSVSRYGVRGRNEAWQIKQRQTASLRSMRKREARTGRVWCPQTQFGTFVARRGANVFLTGNCYNGINVAMTSPHGHPVELQFHTDASLDAKESIHPLYEAWRTTNDKAIRSGIAQKMVDRIDQSPLPPGVLSIQPYTRTPGYEHLGATSAPERPATLGTYRFLLVHDPDDAPLALLRVEPDGDVARWEGGGWNEALEYGRFVYLGEPRSEEITEAEAQHYIDSGALQFFAHVAPPKEASMSAEEWGLLFEADLHDEPEPALPTTDGGDEDEQTWSGYAGDPEPDPHHGSVTIPDSVRGSLGQPTYKPVTATTTSEWGDQFDVSGADQAALAVAAALSGAAAQRTVASATPAELQAMAEANIRAGGRGADDDIMAAAQAGLQTEALKTYSPAERQQIIREGEGGESASNLDRLDLSGTHYEALEARRSATASEDEVEDLGWDTMGDPNLGDM